MTVQGTEKAYIHWLCQAVGRGNRKLLEMFDQTSSPREIYELAAKGLLEEKISGKYKRKAKQIQEAALRFDVQSEYEKMTDRGIFLLTVKEADYPRKLAAIPDAPYALYYAGKMPQHSGKSIALIGARNCSEYGKIMAKLFGEALARAGVQVVSGMARGIDGIGQQAALDAGGYSLGVLGSGVDICYPPENRELYERLLAQGGICSEYPPGIEPRAELFPPRNRIISGLCDGVLVIEAKERSGTLITVDMALEQGREVYALPGRITDPLSSGCNRLIRQGAELVISPQEVLQGLHVDYCEESFGVHRKLPVLEQVQGQLLQLLDFQPKSMDLLQRAYADAYGRAISIPELCRELLRLCALEYAGRVGANYYVRTGKGME